ncbi:MAG: ubiquinol-cytochrome c reductase iron-sulfur subunit [Acidobacteriia bacterium]|nr:ubiquinol-cytochrome c reductase iron-sulfur subunit [Terriglobia bacterium]
MTQSKDSTGAQVPNPPEEVSGPTRRNFLSEITAMALGVAGIGSIVVTTRYLSPNVLFEPPTSFRIGPPDDYLVNSVTYLPDQQVYIVRTPEGFYAESAVCTHLGCITQWKPELNMIACPCHGSKFKRDGSVEAGPAPRPLNHFAIRLTPDGDLLVDTLETVQQTQVLKA